MSVTKGFVVRQTDNGLGYSRTYCGEKMEYFFEDKKEAEEFLQDRLNEGHSVKIFAATQQINFIRENVVKRIITIEK